MLDDMIQDYKGYAQRRRDRRNQFWGNIPPGCWHFSVIIIGIVILLGAFQSLLDWGQSLRWNQTVGQVVRAEVIRTQHSEESRGNVTYWYTYRPLIEYQYRVNGEIFTSRARAFDLGLFCSGNDCLVPPRESENPISPQKVVQKYAVNSRVTVYYNPANPAEAILERRVSTSVLLALGLGLLLTCMGGGMFIWWVTSSKKSARPQVMVSETSFDRKKRSR